jgi:release factor glutamine methyltransferase
MPAPTGCSSTEFAPRHPTSQVMLEEQGLRVDVIARREIPFGPVLTARRRMLASRGIITADQRSEEIVVIRGRQHA